MKKLLVLVCAILGAFSVNATAKDPPTITSADQLKTGMGAVRISIRSQLQYGGPLFVWFAPVNANQANTSGAFSISRKQGAPFAGTNMIDSRPKVFALPPGSYRLIAHSVICEALPPPGTACFSFGTPVPTGRYDSTFVEFEIIAGKITDAGEFILELPSTIDVGGNVSYKQAYKQMDQSAIRWRKISASIPTEFSGMELAPVPSVPSELISAINCEIKPSGLKGASLFYPFKC